MEGQIAILPKSLPFCHNSPPGALAFYLQSNQEYIRSHLGENSPAHLLFHPAEAGELIIHETNQSMQINQQILVAHLLNDINPVFD